jgi:hypothetical protein
MSVYALHAIVIKKEGLKFEEAKKQKIVGVGVTILKHILTPKHLNQK